jgi:glucosyl-dolichyl phosphate glucuronosyltransferase
MARTVSVVVASHALARFASLLETLDSVDRQSLPADRLVVAVDHSPELAARLRNERPDLAVALNDGPHRGASATRNAGVDATTSEIVAFLDDDEIADADWLGRLVEPFDDPLVVGTGGAYVPRWARRKPVWFPDEFAWVVGGAHAGLPVVPTPVRNVWSGNMAVRADAFRSVGGFTETFGKVGGRSRPEDTDLCVRMARGGGVWIYLPDAKIQHAVPADRSTFRFFVARSYAEGRGKIDLQKAHGDSAVLADERDFLTRVVPRGLRRNSADALSACGRLGALLIGVAAAGTGAAVSKTAHLRAARAGRRERTQGTDHRLA